MNSQKWNELVCLVLTLLLITVSFVDVIVRLETVKNWLLFVLFLGLFWVFYFVVIPVVWYFAPKDTDIKNDSSIGKMLFTPIVSITDFKKNFLIGFSLFQGTGIFVLVAMLLEK